MNILKIFIRFADSISSWTGRIFCWAVVVLTLLTFIEIVMRRLFDSPTIWSFEICKQIDGIYFMILGAYGLMHGAHVSIDIIYARLSKRKKAVLDVISYILFFFPFNIVIFWKGFEYAKRSWDLLEKADGFFAIPVYPVKTFIPLAALLLIIQGLAIFIKKFYFATKLKEIDL